jgi:hypothetical protein
MDSLLRSIQHHIARVAINSSSMRGAGSPGVVAAVRAFLGTMPLRPFGTSLLITVMAAVGVSQQKSATELAIVVEYREKPTTLERATARAHAVVRARVVGSQFRKLLEPSAAITHVNTAYGLKVVEVLKQNPQLPIPTEVLRPGGDLETDQGIQRFVEEGFPAFQPGDEYLLFLYWNESLAAYQMISGADSAYRITPDNRLHGLGRGLLAQRYTGQDAREVANRIRDIADGVIPVKDVKEIPER